MEISIIRDHKKVFDYNSMSRKHKKILVLSLAAFDLTELQKGNLVLAPVLKNANFIKDIFQMEFFYLGFSIGTFFLVCMAVMILIQIAPAIGEMLQGNDIANWILGIVGIAAIVIIALF